MQQKKLFYLALASLLVILVGAAVATLDFLDPYKFKAADSIQGISFRYQSVEAPPGNLLKGLSSRTSFLLAPAFTEGDNANAYTGTAWVLFRSVLSANRVENESLLRAYSKDHRLLKCQYDSKSGENKEITAQECQSMIDAAPPQAAKVFIEAPDPAQPWPAIIVTSDSLTIRPKQGPESALLSKRVLQFLYVNTDDIIAKSNELLDQLN